MPGNDTPPLTVQTLELLSGELHSELGPACGDLSLGQAGLGLYWGAAGPAVGGHPAVPRPQSGEREVGREVREDGDALSQHVASYLRTGELN